MLNKSLSSVLVLGLCGAIGTAGLAAAAVHNNQSNTSAEYKVVDEKTSEINNTSDIINNLKAETGTGAGVTNLDADTEYEYDLDQDGTNEIISYSMTENGTYTVTVNGSNALTLDLDDSYYDPELQIMDIDKNDNSLDLWAYSYCCSDDIGFSTLYHYENGQLVKIFDAAAEDDDEDAAFVTEPGEIYSTDGNGQFTIRMDRAIYVDALTGNHWDAAVYELKDNQLSLVSTDTFAITDTLCGEEDCAADIDGIHGLTSSNAIQMYKAPDKTSETVTIAAGTVCYPVAINTASAPDLYVEYKTEDGQTGWLCTADYDFENTPFENEFFAD